jgi:hypothetical protein
MKQGKNIMIELSNNHYTIEAYKQRMSVKDWKEILLKDMDTIVFKGNIRQLEAKNLGYGVVEVYKTPIKDN